MMIRDDDTNRLCWVMVFPERVKALQSVFIAYLYFQNIYEQLGTVWCSSKYKFSFPMRSKCQSVIIKFTTSFNSI